MHKRWILKQTSIEADSRDTGDVGIHPLLARILASRGVTDTDEMRQFLSPSLRDMHDPSLMKGMEEAVRRLMLARRRSETIWVYGDYDVDGITGVSLLVSFLKEAGYDCRYFIPNRFDDGYGLNSEALAQLIDQGAQVIISVDCGITAVAEAFFCRQRGVDLIIVDHHSPHDQLPDACAVINPLQPDCPYPFKGLAGVGVAFNFLVALRTALRSEGAFANGEPDLRRWLDLVALGTIADVVPLRDQNRIYVTHGLRSLSNSRKPGITALKRAAGLEGTVTSGQVGFRLAPRLNAAGRMESAVGGVELLLSNDAQAARILALELDAANAERQNVERHIQEEAIAMVENGGRYPDQRSIVLSSKSWHQGVIGIVASRLVDRFYRPAILLTEDELGNAKGSGRSIPGFHLLEALNGCSGYLERFGGHRHAAGVSLSAGNIDAFRASFESEAIRLLDGRELIPELALDLEVQPEDINEAFVAELKRMEPFGMGNPEPLLLLRSVRVVEQRVVGGSHLRLKVTGNGATFNAIAFGMGSRDVPEMLDLACFPEQNQWNGSTSLQLRVKDFRAAEGAYAA